jgi:septation ring formation regulator EzrA
MIIKDDLNELIYHLEDFAQKHQIHPLKIKTGNLEQTVEAFDVEKIRHYLTTIKNMFD